MLDEYFKDIVTQYQYSLRDVVMKPVKNGIPTPGLSASINYYDSYRTENLPVNLIQAVTLLDIWELFNLINEKKATHFK